MCKINALYDRFCDERIQSFIAFAECELLSVTADDKTKMRHNLKSMCLFPNR